MLLNRGRFFRAKDSTWHRDRRPLRCEIFAAGISGSPCMKWCSFIEELPAGDAEVLILVAAVVLSGASAMKCLVCAAPRGGKNEDRASSILASCGCVHSAVCVAIRCAGTGASVQDRRGAATLRS